MQMASSANRTCREWRSASEYTATVRIPSSLQAPKTRSAISPRLAIRIFRNILGELLLAAGADSEKRLAVFHRVSVFGINLHHFPRHVGFDFVHQFHRFHDAE